MVACAVIALATAGYVGYMIGRGLKPEKSCDTADAGLSEAAKKKSPAEPKSQQIEQKDTLVTSANSNLTTEIVP